ncbi:hypothetical protein J2W55_003369 [Mucilaginibacter pocheonensis]|uniref:Uncharacterized protein n=1 Tax=Mucilaginibacter pocheonensis TaxID=398050 RepID=A0ABU1TF73_9SPHI|nr:hypothetical protein [Mucilaginibacter pocheonensis]
MLPVPGCRANALVKLGTVVFSFIIRSKVIGAVGPKKGQQCGDISQKVGKKVERFYNSL